MIETDLPADGSQPGNETLRSGKVSGFPTAVQDTVTKGIGLFEDAIKSVISANVNAFYEVLAELSHPPSEIGIEFGLKISAELGNVVVSKAGAEANYTVKLNWKPTLASVIEDGTRRN